MKLLIIIAVLILYKYFWNIDNLNIEKLFGYNMNGNKKKQFFTPYKKINNKTDSIYGENGMDTSLYQKDTIYDKLVDIFTKKENQYNDCTNNAELEDWQREINMTFKLITTHNIIFNRDSIPVIRYFQEIDKDNTLLPIAQSAIDIFNEKANKTSIITDIKNIETLETEDQIQYTFDLFLNYPTIDKNNVPIFKNIRVKVILIKRRLIQDDIFAPNRYDTTKFLIKHMELINHKEIDTKPEIKKGEKDYYSFKKLMTETGEFTDDKYIDKEMIRNRKKHEHEMDFRNIIIEDDNYLNNYMNPDKLC